MNKAALRDTGINICRFALAFTLIFSGYVKAIDPTGTQYKLNDYLSAMGMEGMLPDYVLLITATMLAAVEFSLGIFLLFAIRRRIVSKIVFVFMLLMTMLTVWVAIADPVKDCGCFGDAVKLTNTQTLAKNVVLLAAATAVAYRPLAQIRFISRTNQWIAVNYTIIYSLATSAYCLYNLPVFDFRPYHIGADIRKGMEIPEGAEQPQFETTFLLKKDGKTKEFTLDDYPDSTWTFIDSKTVQLSEGYVPPIHDLTMEDITTGEDLTEQIIGNKGYTFLLIAPHLENADDSNFGDINRIYDYCMEHGYGFVALTASNDKAQKRWSDMTGAEYTFLFTDETVLKTMIRSNPGLLLLKNGTVIQKWSHNSLPQLDEASPALEKLPEGNLPEAGIEKKITYTLLWFFLPLILLTLADRLWAWTKWIKVRKKSTETSAYGQKEDKNEE